MATRKIKLTDEQVEIVVNALTDKVSSLEANNDFNVHVMFELASALGMESPYAEIPSMFRAEEK